MKTRTRKGLLGTKLGMTQVWDENNRIVPVTVVEAGPCGEPDPHAGDRRLLRGPVGVRRHRPAQGQQARRRTLRQGRGDPAPTWSSCAPRMRRSTRWVRSSPQMSSPRATWSM